MSNIQENAFQIARYIVENGQRIHSYGLIRKELGLSDKDFESAYQYLIGHECCHTAGQHGDDAQVFVDKGIYPFYSKEKDNRISLSMDAESLLKYLVESQSPDFQVSSAHGVITTLRWDKVRYMKACRILADEGLIKGMAADNNPYWEIFVLPEGRKIVRNNFRSPYAISGTHTNSINISGNNNILAVGSVLSNATQIIQATPSLSDPDKRQIASLLEKLDNHLKDVPPEKADDAEAVAESAKDLIEKATRERPNRRLIELSADKLKKAAQILVAIPPLISIVQDIIAFIEKMSGIHISP